MIAIDTSSLIAYFSDVDGKDVEAVEFAFQQQCGVFPPVVLCEMLSDHKITSSVIKLLTGIPLLVFKEGYWERAGLLRGKILSKGFKARLADTLIAQSCIDNDIPLVTRANDFRHFHKLGGLKLV